MYVLGDNSILKRATDAKLQTDIEQWKERLELAKNPIIIDGLGTIDKDKYFEYIEKLEYIKDKSTDIIDNEDGTYDVTTKPGYIFEITLLPSKENPRDIEIDYIGKEDNLLPKIKSIVVTSKNSNSIAIEVTVNRLNGGNLSYYYKKESETEYYKLEGKQDTTDLTATFTSLEQNKIYNIKVIAKNKSGSSEEIINVLTGELQKGTIRQKGETVWSNNKASIELETTNTKLTMQYQINGIDGTWLPYEGAIGNLNHNDTVYAILTDGTNYGDIATIEIRDGLNPTATISGLTSSVTAGSTILATVTHSDNESGVKLASCKWVFTTSSTKIGTDESKYTGTFSSESGKITWSTSSTGTYYLHVLTVDNAGNKEETVSSSSVRVNPKTVSVTGVSVSPTSVTLDVGSTKQLTATVSPSNATNKSVTWSSSNTSVATVSSSGLVTAKAAGSATITVRTSSGSKTATCSVTVRTPTISVTGVSVSPTSATLNVGSTKQLTATISPSNATNKSVTWSSSNSSVATVSSTGLVTAKAIGSTTITVKTTDGSNKSATCSVTVQLGSNTASWEKINEIAKAIAKDSSITSSSKKATGTLDSGEKYEISVGDIYKVQYDGVEKQVRVLGFKHDDLVNIRAYGGNHSKASITFDFVDFMTGTTYMSMHTSDTNSGGWAKMKLRQDLNGYTTIANAQSGDIGGLGAKLSNKDYIKQVKKYYITTFDIGTLSTSDDYLWLLSCAEIVNTGYTDGTSGNAKTREGSQYPYYKEVTTNIPWNTANPALVKKGSNTGSANYWWLRSPHYNSINVFCYVGSNGGLSNTNGNASYTRSVAPGFCI